MKLSCRSQRVIFFCRLKTNLPFFSSDLYEVLRCFLWKEKKKNFVSTFSSIHPRTKIFLNHIAFNIVECKCSSDTNFQRFCSVVLFQILLLALYLHIRINFVTNPREKLNGSLRSSTTIQPHRMCARMHRLGSQRSTKRVLQFDYAKNWDENLTKV